MKLTKLIIDTTIDRNLEMEQKYDFEVIPLSIILDNQSYLDGEEITVDAVYEAMRSGKVPKTSQISYESLTKVLDKGIQENEDMIYLSFSSKMSGTYQFAHQIMEEYKEKYPERKMALVDSRGGAGGGALVALQALKMIEAGKPFDEIVRQMKWNIDHVLYKFTLRDLDWLVKGGRVNKTTGYVGTALNIKPYLIVDDGFIKMHKLVRGEKKIYKKLIEDVKSGLGNFTDQTIGISHGDDEETARAIEAKLKEELPDCQTQVFRIGAVLGSHIGIGGIGVFYFDERPEWYQN
ncbi:DegV family protein [Carnobacterium viridans]|uniref:DegV family protein n=1 Tax=Carnobacterium viridans TaxID=174587 RepID=UPI000B7F0D7D|nr:DegV family protein [Carnobacterium viridans]UDE95096.1 DegV family protein [Carnobacterium viridans]